MSDTDKTAEKLIASVQKSQASAKPAPKRAPSRKKPVKVSATSMITQDRPRPSQPEKEGYSKGGLRWPD